MRLNRIKLVDFRQFKGTQILDFSNEDSRNVTVVYGENGRGKTGIFRALMFCLYGDRSLSQDELTNEQKKNGLNLVNEVTLKEKIERKVTSYVEIQFSHKEKQYNINRKISGLMQSDGTIIQNGIDEVELQETEIGGNTLPAKNDPIAVNEIIYKILNQRLRDYFLFDGERIERLTRNTMDRRKEVQDGIRSLLDLDAMALAIDGLGKLTSSIGNDIKNKATGKLKIVTSCKGEVDNEITKLKNDQEHSEQELKRLQRRIKELSTKISENKETAAQEKKRQELIEAQNDIENKIDSIKKEIAGQLNKSSQLVSIEIVEQLREELEHRREKGQLPPYIRKEFVEDLLKNERCICGTYLKQNSKEIEQLQIFMQEYFESGLGRESEELLRNLNRVSSSNDLLSNDFSRLLMENKNLHDNVDELERKIKSIGDELGSGGTNIDDLIFERVHCEEDVKKLKKEITLIEENNRIKIEERNKLEKDISDLIKKQDQLRTLRSKQDLIKDTSIELEKIYKSFADEAKGKLAEKSTEIFSYLADLETQKDIKKISIDENYMLDVLNWAGHRRLGEISAGQRQIVSLSFIMALIQVAGDLEVPLFMDTPFGRLSGVHRDHLLETIPKMATQWILLVTDTEFTEFEANSLRQTNCWGKIYELSKQDEGITKIIEHDVNQFIPKRRSIN